MNVLVSSNGYKNWESAAKSRIEKSSTTIESYKS